MNLVQFDMEDHETMESWLSLYRGRELSEVLWLLMLQLHWNLFSH